MSVRTQATPTLTIHWETREEARWPRAILSYSIDSQYLTSTDEFEVTLWDSDPARLRGLALEPVQLRIHGKTVLIGRVERVERGASGSAVVIRGRDYFAELVEGELDPGIKIPAEFDFNEVVPYCAGPYGISKVQSIGYLSLKGIPTGERKPEPGTGCYDFLNRMAARLGVTLQPSTVDRNTVIFSEPRYREKAIGSLLRSNDPVVQAANNVEQASSTEDYTRLPTLGLASGKVAKTGESPSTVSHTFDLAAVFGEIAPNIWQQLGDKTTSVRRTPKEGPKTDQKLYRLLYVKDDDARTDGQVARAISRASCERLKDTLEYRAQLTGHRDEKTCNVWAIDTILNVKDSVCDIEEPLWVAGVRFEYSGSQGATTTLTMWRLGSLQL
jgi:prophage tail gpP-like protein